MQKHYDSPDDWDAIREEISGLGERSFRKSYYPELQQRLADLERFRALLDESNDAIFLIEVPSGRLVDVNESACHQLGYLREELLDRSIYEVTNSAASLLLTGVLSGDFGESTRQTITTTLVKHDGGELAVEVGVRLVNFGETTYGVAVARDLTERKQTELERSRLSNYLRLLLDSTDEGIYGIDLQARCMLVNRSGAAMVGYKPEDLLGKNMHETMHHHYPDGKPYPVEDCQVVRAIRLGQGVRIDSEVFWRRDGTSFPVEYSSYPIVEEGIIKGAVVMFVDITERKRAEEERDHLVREQAAHAETEAARKQISNILESISDAFFALNREWRFTYVNKEAERLLRRKRSDLLGKSIWTEFPEMRNSDHVQEYQRAMSEGKTLSLETYFSPLNAWLEIHVYPSRDGLSIYFRDVTARKQAEAYRERLLEEVERRAAELDTSITSMADGIAIYSPTGEIVRMNPAAENILGYSQFERRLPLAERMALLAIETADGKLFPLDQMPSERALRGETVRGVVAVIHQPSDGKAVWIAASGAPIHAPDGRLLGAVSIFTDITALHQLEEQLEDLIRTVSHDLRSPLTIITGQAQLAHRHADKPELVRKSTEAIRTSAGRMNAMIQDLVDMARLEGGQLRLEKSTVDLKAFVHDLLERGKTVIDTARIKIDISPDITFVPADPDRLERILLNLLTNSLKYSEPGTDVLLEAQETDGEVTVSITDRGEGIAPNDLARIFDRYYRAKQARKSEGLGLGLYITKILVEAHGGRVWAETTPGVGSTFYFTVPLA